MPSTLAELATLVAGTVHGDASKVITGVAPLTEAGPDQITFLRDDSYRQHLGLAQAGAILIKKPTEHALNFVVVADPDVAFGKVLRFFHPSVVATRTQIHPTAVLDPTAELEAPVVVGPHAVVGAGTRIGSGTIVHAGVVIGSEVRIGQDCTLHPKVVVYDRVTMGDRVAVHAGSVLGADGFGYAREDGEFHKVPQIGTVVIEDDVEIGACTTIDRAALGVTRICRGAKIDNLVMVGHNCVVGEHTAIAAQVGLSGSTRIGKRNMIAGQSGFAGHISTCDDVVVGPGSGVPDSIKEPGVYLGVPVQKGKTWLRFVVEWNRMQEVRRKVEALERKLGP